MADRDASVTTVKPGASTVKRPRPKVSVVVTAYNKQSYIADAVNSVLAQTEPDIEVVVVDDCSIDSTREVVLALAARDPRVRLIALPVNVGQPAALNIGMAEAAGDWVAILDGDDWVAPELYRTLLDLAARTGASVLGSDMQWVDDGRMLPWRRLLPPGTVRPLVLDAEAFIRRSMPYQLRPLSFLQPMMRREVVRTEWVRYDESDRFDLDFGILVRAALAGGPIVISPAVGYYYRQLPGSMISSRNAAVLRRMKGANDALLAICERQGDASASAWIARRSTAVAREVARAELVAAIRSRRWRLVAVGMLAAPQDVATLAWRRVRGRLFWAWRKWETLARLRTARGRAVCAAALLDASLLAEGQVGAAGAMMMM